MVVSFLLCGFVCFVGFITGYVFNVYMQGGTRARTLPRSRRSRGPPTCGSH